MSIIVIGTGPVGGIIGGRLARAGRDITFVDTDREHVSAIREHGLQVDVPDGAFNVKIPIYYPDEVEGTFDIGFIAVRSHYTAEALAEVMPHLAPEGLLVSLQNGINPPLLEEKVGPERAIGVAIRMGCLKTAPGRVYTAARGHLYCGHLHGRTTPQLTRLAALFNSIIPTEISPDIFSMLWSKLTYTCLGYFGSLADAAPADSCAGETEQRLLVDFLAEVVAVGQAGGVRFPPLKEYNPSDLHPDKPFAGRLAVINKMAESWKPDDRTGQLRTIKSHIKTEVDFTLGHVVREGRRLGIATPLCRKLLEMIHELETGARPLALQNYTELAATGSRSMFRAAPPLELKKRN